MVISGIDPETSLTHLYQTTCNRWSCSACGPWKTWMLCKQCEAAEPNRFITLTTSHHETREPREVWDQARRQVPELIRWLRKHRGPTEYCRVLEEHKSGYPHFHLLVRGPYVKQSTLSDQWCRLTDAFRVDIRRVDPGGKVARYIAKYLSKTTSVGMTQRRVTASKGFFPAKPPKEPSSINLEMVRRSRGTIDSVWYWEFPHSILEEVSANHWVVAQPEQIPRGKRYDPKDKTSFQRLVDDLYHRCRARLDEAEGIPRPKLHSVHEQTRSLFD